MIGQCLTHTQPSYLCVVQFGREAVDAGPRFIENAEGERNVLRAPQLFDFLAQRFEDLM